MNGEPVTILTGRDDPNDLEVLTSRLVAEKFKVLPVADRTAIVTLARSEVSTYKVACSAELIVHKDHSSNR